MLKKSNLFEMPLNFEDLPTLQEAVNELGFSFNSNEDWEDFGGPTPLAYVRTQKREDGSTDLTLYNGFEGYDVLYFQVGFVLEDYIGFKNTYKGLSEDELYSEIIRDQLDDISWDEALAYTDEFSSYYDKERCEHCCEESEEGNKLLPVFERTLKNCEFYKENNKENCLLNEIGVMRGIMYALEETTGYYPFSKEIEDFIKIQQDKTAVERDESK